MPYNRRRPVSEARKQRIDQQQAILQRLREGGALSGAQPATPLATFGRTATILIYMRHKNKMPLVEKFLFLRNSTLLKLLN
jgi:hypothetical protein